MVNNGSDIHSFDIDDLNVATGPIDPGGAKTITISLVPGEGRNYNYYSKLDGGSSDFSGVMMVAAE